jgi:hypothetical protein
MSEEKKGCMAVPKMGKNGLSPLLSIMVRYGFV